MNKKIKCIMCWVLIPIMIFAICIQYKAYSVPNTIFLRENQKLESNCLIKVGKKCLANKVKRNEEVVDLNFLGIMPLKSVSVKSVPDIYVYPGGTPVGVKLSTKGVLVVAFSDIETSSQINISPCAECGIQIGDSLVRVNNTDINNSEDLINQLEINKDKKLTLVVERNNKTMKKVIKPIKDKQDGKYKIGLWVRDSTSGVGTLTFYHKNSNKFGALGHPITDVDTGTILKIKEGEILESSIVSVRKGQKGNPGELRGIFVNEDTNIGKVSKNTICGIYGEGNNKLVNKEYNKPMKIALRNEIKQGPAKILTTVDGNKPELYDIEIENLLEQDSPGPKSMVIKITDPKLINKTGGIVQGMSGSPIIQNDKIVGAVTHVLINKPQVGYGIYIEWMLKDAGILDEY